MAKINLKEVATVGIVPKVTNLRVVLQATKVTIGESKSSGNRMATIELEIVGGQTELLDANGLRVDVLGLKPTMFVVLEDDPRSLSSLRELLIKLDLPTEVDMANDQEIMELFGKIRFEALISSQQNKVTEWDTTQGKEVPAKDAEGRQLLGPCTWMPVNSRSILGAVAPVN